MLRTMMAVVLIAAGGCKKNDMQVDGSVPGEPDAGPGPLPDGAIPGSDATVGNDAGESDGWRVIAMAGEDERVTGVYCESASRCVVSTDASTSHVYATDGNTITATLLTSDFSFGEMLGVLGSPAFHGFSKVDDLLIAQLAQSGRGFVSARGDFMAPSSWTAISAGHADGADFGLNSQVGFGTAAGRWLQFRQSQVFETTGAPSTTSFWERVWEPVDLDALRREDPTLCISEPRVGGAPSPTRTAYVAPDLSLVAYPANALNQRSMDTAGMCISTDGGRRFHHVAFPDVAEEYGPSIVTCTSSEHCVVLAGATFDEGSTYAYVTRNASAGVGSTWTRAALPPFTDGQTLPHHAFFAPDGAHGFAVLEDRARPTLWTTSDGGDTWTDISAEIRGFDPGALWAGFAVDATHVVIGGAHDTLLVRD